jgi:ABC-2 type transport system permease protein
MNWRAVWAIYTFEMARTGRTLLQSIVAPVITTSLYFVVFGAAMGTRISQIEECSTALSSCRDSSCSRSSRRA